MPGRKVHFSSAKNTFHSPPLMSPTESSPTTSSGPLTPPPLPYASFPGPTPYLPQHSYGKASSGQANNLIAFSNTPLLNYDMTLHPSTISTHYMGISPAGFLEPAVLPPKPAISLATPHLPWFIGVTASNGRYVTVSDVLNAIYSTLRVNITPADYDALGSARNKRRMSAAYTQRYERLRGHHGYAEEKAQGAKRVDFLMGNTKFHGISPSGGAQDVWQLHIG